MRLSGNARILVGLLFILILFEGGFVSMNVLLSTGSYVTGYEGAKAQFVGVQHGGKDYKESLWGTVLKWDADDRGWGKPAIAGEMTSVFVPQESVGYQPNWIPSEWLLSSTTIRNPIREYEWELPTGGKNETAFYRMEEWQLKWYFSISSEPTGDELPEAYVSPSMSHLTARNSLQDAKIWFEFDIQPTWYFENASHAYFAIAEVRMSDVSLHGVKDDGEREEANKECRVSPQSKSSILTLYYGLFGSEANRADKQTYDYKGKKLNPDLFTDKVYSYFTLDDFGVDAWWAMGYHWRGDVVTVGVDVHIFVIGEWVVKDIQEVPEDYGRSANIGGTNILSPFGEFFASPYGRLGMVLLAGLIFIVILAIVAPTFLLALFAIFRSGKRR